MQILRTENLEHALRYARQGQAEGEFDLFRGQVQRWPLIPTLLRLSEARLEEAEARMDDFLHWVEGTPDVAAMLPTLQSRIAVAQHYGLPTPLMDVSRDPRIAGFFASHTAHPPPAGTESCLFCFHGARIREATERLRRGALEQGFDEEQIQLPSLIEIDVSNLWRLQAQHGAFLLAPDWIARNPEDRLVEHMLEVTCLVFPYEGPLAGIEERRVYPDRKSALEIRLDEYFAQEAVGRRNREARDAGFSVIDGEAADAMARQFDFRALGFKPEVAALLDMQHGAPGTTIFEDGIEVGPEPSWTDPEIIGPWVAEVDEHFHDAFTDERWRLVTDDDLDLEGLESWCVQQVEALLAHDPVARRRAVRWRLVDGAGQEVAAPCDEEEGHPDPERTTAGDWLALAWDGMRALPYHDREVAIALGRIAAALAWTARGRSPWVVEAPMHLELVMPMGLDPVVDVPEAAFQWALRDDLPLLLADRWAHLADDPRLLLLAVGRPPLLVNFERWRWLFAVHLIPSQLVLNAQGGASVAIYNPVLPVGIRGH